MKLSAISSVRLRVSWSTDPAKRVDYFYDFFFASCGQVVDVKNGKNLVVLLLVKTKESVKTITSKIPTLVSAGQGSVAATVKLTLVSGNLKKLIGRILNLDLNCCR